MRRIFFILLFLTIPLSLMGKSLSIGVAAPHTGTFLEKNQNLISILFDAIFKELENIPNRTATTAEHLEKLGEEYEKDRVLLSGALREAQYQRDLLIHATSTDELIKIENTINNIQTALDNLEIPRLNASDKESKLWDIQYVWKNDVPGDPLHMPLSTDIDVLREYALSLGLDGIILFFIEEIENDLWVSLQYYNRLTHSMRRINSELITSKDGLINSDAFITSLRGEILGRPWAHLIIEDAIPSLEIKITDDNGDSQIYYPGDVSLRYLTPGNINVLLSGYDYIDEEIPIVLDPYKRLIISGYLEKKESPTFYLDAHKDFKVYGNELYIGHGTQELQNLSIPGTLRVTNGVNNYTFILREESDPYLNAMVLDDTISYQTIVNQREKQFYRSFAFFMLSIPTSILTYQVKKEYQQANPNSMLGSFWNAVFYTSITANVFGGIRFFIDVSRFVNAEDIIYSRE